MAFDLFMDNEGLSLRRGDTTYIQLLDYSLSKKDAFLENDKLIKMFEILVKYYSQINNLNIKQPLQLDSSNTTIFRKKDYCNFTGKYLFKYINHDSLKYINEGKFQLGSLLYYRKMENLKARDELEGINYFNITLVDREFGSLLTAGFNYYIFCATNQDDGFKSDYHTDCFGRILLKIDATPFMDKISEIIGSYSYKIYIVRYSDAKIYKAYYPIPTSPEEMSNFTSGYVTKLFHYLKDETILPCLFTKPYWFKPENEVRVAFEMPYNASSSPLRFECKDLLNHIEIIHL